MARSRRFRKAVGAALVAVLSAVLSAGCGGEKYHPVGGVVRLDGHVVPNAAVTLMPVGPGRPAVGATDADGRFTLSTGNTPGVPPGAYTVVVVVSGPSATDERKPVPAAAGTSRLPARYAKPETSGLSVTVPTDGPNAYDLVLTGGPE